MSAFPRGFVSPLALALISIAAHPVGAAPISNACRNSVTANSSQTTVDTTGTASAPVAPGGTITLSSIQQTATFPGSLFVAGYNLGLLSEGQNQVPANVFTRLEGTNTTEGVKNTSLEAVLITTTIVDPDHVPGTGDESATDGVFSVTYDNQTWTGAASPGTVAFRQDTVQPLAPSPEFSEQGSLIVRALIGGFFKVRIACSPGTVTPPDPGTVTFVDPAEAFASTTIATDEPTPTETTTPTPTETQTTTPTRTVTPTPTETQTLPPSPTRSPTPTPAETRTVTPTSIDTAVPTPTVATTAIPTIKSTCNAGKLKCVAARQSCVLVAHSKAQKKGVAVDGAALQKCSDKFDGGTKGFTKGCIGALEAKQNPAKPATMCAVTGDVEILEAEVDSFVDDVVTEIGMGTTSPNTCDSAKIHCVRKNVACLLSTYRLAEKKGVAVDSAAVQKCRDKFDGGTKGATKGCIGKLEAKADSNKPKTICSVTGDLATLSSKVGTFVSDVVGEIRNAP